MSYEKETPIGPVEKEIKSIMEAAGNEIMDHTGVGTKESETVQKIHIVNLGRCVICLARQIDKLAGSIK
jgi:hypothetical protein